MRVFFVVCLLVLVKHCVGFTFMYPSLSLDDSHVGFSATYTVTLTRIYDGYLSPTNWMNEPVPSNANATVIFPPQYTHSLISNAQCLQISVNSIPIASYSCSVSSLTVIVQGAFASTSLVSDVTIILGSITNPGSALTTSPFLATIGQDTSASSQAAELTFTPGTLAGSTITFVNPIVNTTSALVITLVPTHQVPQDGGVTIQFPASLSWARDLSTFHTLPINGTLGCYGLTANIVNSTITCEGLFSTQTVTVKSFLSSALPPGQTISFAIVGIFSPPTTQPADTLTITTRDSNLNAIDWGSNHISGLQAVKLLSYTMSSQLSSGVGVNNFLYGLVFTFTLPDTLGNEDVFVIAFPSGTTISYTFTSLSIPYQSVTYNSTNTSLIVTQKSTNPNYPASTVVSLSFIRYKAPPSTKPTDPIVFTVVSRGYSKMTASSTFTALPNNYSSSVSPASLSVNTLTQYVLVFTMADSLTSTGYFRLKLDPQLTQTSAQTAALLSSTVTLTGTGLKSTPSWQWTSSTVNGSQVYVLEMSNFNTSAGSIAIQQVTVTLTNLLNPSAVVTLSSFSLQTFYSSANADLVATASFLGSLLLTPGNISLLQVSSTATSTYTFTQLTLQINLQNQVPAGGAIALVLPQQLSLLSVTAAQLSKNGSALSATFIYGLSNGTITCQLQALLSSGEATITVMNIMTQNTTQPTAAFGLSSWDNLGRNIDQGLQELGLTLTQGNVFNSLTLQRTNQQNSQLANYTISYEQIQNYQDITQITITLHALLSLDSLSRIYQLNSQGQQQPLLFSRSGQILNITLSFSNQTVTLTLEQVRNPPSLSPLASGITLTTVTSNRLYLYSSMSTPDLVNSAASSDPAVTFEFNSTIWGEGTRLKLSLWQPTTFVETVYLAKIDIPSEFGITGFSCSGFTGLLCSLSTRTVKVQTTNSSYLPNPALLYLDGLTAPSLAASGGAPFLFPISTFDANNYLVQQYDSAVQFSSNCTSPCRTCSTGNSSSCLSCYSTSSDNLLYNGQCLSSCPAGSYQVSEQCEPCDSICLTCAESASNCTSCDLLGSTSLFYANLSSLTCVAICPEGTFNQSNVCESCPQNCSACEVGQCLACLSGFYLFQGVCLESCPNGTFVNLTQCSPCSSSCLTCQTLVTNCTSCSAYLLLSSGSCLSSCPSTSQFISASHTCQSCDVSCLTCSMNALNCTSCNVSSSLPNYLSNQCLSDCPPLYYANSTTQQCLLCSGLALNCSNCSSETTCLSCDAGFYLLSEHCQSEVPIGYLPVDGELVPCNATCLTCQVSIENCTSCGGVLNLLNGSCLSLCPLGDYVPINNTCLPCSFPCMTCVNATSLCLSCQPTSLLFLEGNACIQGSSCPNGTYPDSSTWTCSPCSSACLLCSSLPSNCSSCSANYFLEGNACLAQCPVGKVGVEGACLSCNGPCVTCEGSQDNCTSCLSLYLTVNSCVGASLCPNDTFPNATTLVCQSCLSPCLTCSFLPTNCTSCVAALFLEGSACVEASACPQGKVAGTEGGLAACVPCSSTCLACSLLISNCTACNSSLGLFLLGSSCVNASQCPAGTYPSEVSAVCETCSAPCATCTGVLSCLSCSGSFLLVNSSCLSECPTGTFAQVINNISQCSPCSNLCADCAYLANNCTLCLNSTYLFNNQCLNPQNCPLTTYPDISTLQCSPCLSPCSTCLNGTFCLSCQGSLYLLSSAGSCFSAETCPSGTLPLNTSLQECVSCSLNCSSCSVGLDNCTSCPSGTYLQNYQCVTAQECRLGTWADISAALCQGCPLVCNSCINSSFCLNCSSSALLYDNFCYESCPAGTAPVSSSCSPCLYPCLTCTTAVDLCSSCDQVNASAYFLLNTSCITAELCPLGTYPNSTTYSCSTCPGECSACRLLDVCTACVEGYFLQAVGRCVTECPVGWLGVVESGGGVCRLCSVPCSTCSVVIANCTGCLQNQTSPLFLSGNVCVLEGSCPLGTYASNQSFACQSCSSACSSCSVNSSYCQSCQPNYYLLNSSCLSSCPNTSVGVSWTCQPCLLPCLTCLGSTTTCTSCQSGTFLLESNGSCLLTCPTSMTGVVGSGLCQSCLAGCSSCSFKIDNCTSCSLNYYSLDNTCLSQCPNTHFPNASVCEPCTNNCLTCQSATTCTSCTSSHLLYSATCVSSCPGTSPFNVSNACLNCSQALPFCLGCLSTSASPSCESCSSPYLLFQGICVSSCPSGYQSSNGSCVATNSLVNELTSSLTLKGIFPLPFTITASIVFVACFMSKLQNKHTYTTGIAYSLYGLVQTAVLGYTLLTYSYPAAEPKVAASASTTSSSSNPVDYTHYLLVSLFIIGGLNFIGLTVQSYQLGQDQRFRRWIEGRCNCICYGVVVVLSAVTSYKFKLIVFTKLFHFQCLRAQLENVQKFRLFNFLSFLGVAHEGLVIYVGVLTLMSLGPSSSDFLLFLDLVVVNGLCLLLALAASSKADNFFEEEEDDGIKVNKVMNLYEEYQLEGLDDSPAKKGHLESRDHMLDEDDQFTLSISDRPSDINQPMESDSAIVAQRNSSTIFTQRSPPKIVPAPINASAVMSNQLSGEEKQRVANKWEGTLKDKVQSQEKLSASKEEQQEDEKMRSKNGGGEEKEARREGEWKEAGREGEREREEGERRRGEEEIEGEREGKKEGEVGRVEKESIQNNNEEANIEEVEQRNIFDVDLELPEPSPVSQPPLPTVSLPLNTVEKHELPLTQIQLAPSSVTPPLLTVTQRELKIYKGPQPKDEEDIQEIDLTLNKKQRQLIELRKSIRKRERSQERRSQRSRSREKSRAAESEGFPLGPVGRVTSHHQFQLRKEINPKVETQQEEIKEEVILMLSSGQNRKEIVKGGESIGQQNMLHYPVTPAKEAATPSKDIVEENIQQNLSYIKGKEIQALVAEVGEELEVDDLDKMSGKLLGKKEKGNIIEIKQDYSEERELEEIQWQPSQKHVESGLIHPNIFENRNEASPFTNPLPPSHNITSPQIQPLQKGEDRSVQPVSLRLDFKPDQINRPLQQKTVNPQASRVQKFQGDDALSDFIEETQRTNVVANRSHLLKDKSRVSSGGYQHLEEIQTVRNQSDKEIPEQSVPSRERPPLSRPATSVKSRMYITGLHQVTQRQDSFSRKSSQVDPLNKTTLQPKFKEFKSRELGREEGGSFEMYPSSLSSNKMQAFDEFPGNDEPEKPTIHSRVRSRVKEQPEPSLEGSFARKSMKSYRSRSIEKDQYEREQRRSRERSREGGEGGQGGQAKSRSKSKSRSRSREGNRSSDKKLRELQKIYLQKLQFKP